MTESPLEHAVPGDGTFGRDASHAEDLDLQALADRRPARTPWGPGCGSRTINRYPRRRTSQSATAPSRPGKVGSTQSTLSGSCAILDLILDFGLVAWRP